MKEFFCKPRNARNLTSFKTGMIHVLTLFTLMMKFHDRQSSEWCIRKLISRHCLEKTCTRWNDFLFLITDDRDFRPRTCTNGLVFRECKHIKNIFEDVYFTKNSLHITLNFSKFFCWLCPFVFHNTLASVCFYFITGN
jgi:hypothetical protein